MNLTRDEKLIAEIIGFLHKYGKADVYLYTEKLKDCANVKEALLILEEAASLFSQAHEELVFRADVTVIDLAECAGMGEQ